MTNKLFSNSAFGFIIIALILSSCNNNTQKVSETAEGTLQSLTEKNDNSIQQNEVHSLPAPMQIANAIKTTNAAYSESFLLSLNNNDAATSDYTKTLVLGMCAVDLGYATVYEQKQTSINYFSSSVKTADELKIMGPIDPGIIKRYKENINNQDSLTSYTLSTFKKIHANLLSNNRTEDAYLILTGSFIEGLYLSGKIYEKGKDKNLVNVIGQQKIFLESLTKLLPQYNDKKEIADLIIQLNDLKSIFDHVEITYKSSSNEPNSKEMLPVDISDETLNQIIYKITTIRNSLINQKQIS